MGSRSWPLLFIALLCCVFLATDDAWAGRSRSSNGPVYVQGHFRKDGTYVAPHYRSRPDGNFYNNWSTKGNVNPYTGKQGTRVTPLGGGVYQPPTTAASIAPVPPRSRVDFVGGVPVEERHVSDRVEVWASNRARSPEPATLLVRPADPKLRSVLDGLSPDERISLNLACRLQMTGCVDVQLLKLTAVPFRPDMSRFSSETRQMVETTCRDVKTLGPAEYVTCRGDALKAVLLPR